MFRVLSLGFRVWGSGFRVGGCENFETGLEVSGIELMREFWRLKVSTIKGFLVGGLTVWIEGFGYKCSLRGSCVFSATDNCVDASEAT